MTFRCRSASVLLAIAVLCQPATAGFFGPSTDILKGDALAAKLKSQPIVLSVSGGLLDVRTKGAAVGSFLLSFVASSALASGGGTAAPARNAQQMQQNMQTNMKNMQASMRIATEFNKTLQTAMTKIASDQAEKPKAEIAKEGPVVLVSQQLLASLLQQPGLRTALASANQSPAASDLQLRVSQPEWKLDFSMASSDYTLSYLTEVSLYQKESDTVFFREICKGEVQRKLPLEDWQRDEFAEVALAATEVGNRCVQPFIAALGLTPAAPAAVQQPAAGPSGSEAQAPARPAAQEAAAQPAAVPANALPEAAGTDHMPDTAKALSHSAS